MDWDSYRKERQQDRQDNREAAEKDFKKASILAAQSGMALSRCSSVHYQLRANSYLWNIYPGNRRIYSDKKHKNPFLKLPVDWGLIDVVKAAMELI